jgi:hypothetical protein
VGAREGRKGGVMAWRRAVCVAAVLLPGLAGPSVGAPPAQPRRATPAHEASTRHLATADADRRIDVNRLLMWVANNGTYAFTFQPGLLGGLIFPKGSPKNALYGAGIWFGGQVNGETRVSAGTYSTDFAPGAMLDNVPDNPGKPEYRVYKVVRYSGDPLDTTRVERTSDELAANPILDPLLHDSWSAYMAGAVPHGAPWRLYRLPKPGVPNDSVEVPGPDVLGDQMLWSVYNDADYTSHQAWSTPSNPLGLEIQQTTFAFDRQGALGNTLFLKFRIINKGHQRIDRAYVSVWTDPDLGDGGDDLVGCDTTLSLGFCYNANNSDKVYGATPPSPGFDFFLGPVNRVTGDTLGLTAFDKYINGSDPGTPLDAYNYMQGLNRDGTAVVDPTTGQSTHFFHPGDPITGLGWLDSSPSDRRMLLTSGPFTMQPGDTQTVVAGLLVGQGNDRLSSVAALKFYDISAQDAFDRKFDLPSPPPAPKVSTAEDHGRVMLSWDSASRLNYHQPGYAFEGYNVYQGASAVGPWTRVATFDEINQVRIIYDKVFDLATGQIIPQYPVAFGSDAGVQFSYTPDKDAVNGGPLHDGMQYYFAVTAYGYGPDQFPKVLENAQQSIRATPQRPASGTDPATAEQFPQTYRQADPSRLPTTDQIKVETLDPNQVTGHTYQVTFTALTPPYSGQVGSDTATVKSAWSLTDLTNDKVLLTSQLNRRGDGDYRVLDGIRVSEVGDYFPLLKDAFYEDNNPAHPAQWGADGMPLFFGGAGTARDYENANGDVHTALDPLAARDSFFAVEIRFGNGQTQKAYRFLRLELAETSHVGNAGDPPPGGRGYSYAGFYDVPFTVWDVAHGTQLDVAFTDPTATDSTGTILPDAQQPAEHDSTWKLHDAGAGGRKILIPIRRSYAGTARPLLARDGALTDGTQPLMYVLAMQQNLSDPYPKYAGVDDGDAFKFWWVVPASPNDTIRFTTHALVRGDAALAKRNLERIRVVPNPYYNQSRYELSPINRIVRFINMPEVATVRIYNLAGHLARTLHKTDPTTSVLEWNLQNEQGLPVGSGVYIYAIEAPNVGTTLGRMVVFMEKERLVNF